MEYLGIIILLELFYAVPLLFVLVIVGLVLWIGLPFVSAAFYKCIVKYKRKKRKKAKAKAKAKARAKAEAKAKAQSQKED